MLVLLYSSVYKIVVWQINRHMAIKVIFNIRILPLFLKFIIFPFLQHEDEYNIHPCESLQRSIASLIINTDPDRQQVDTGPGGSVNNCINNITPDHACQYCHCHFCAISGHCTGSQRSQRKNGWSCCSPFIVSICYRTALTPPSLQCRYISTSSVTHTSLN